MSIDELEQKCAKNRALGLNFIMLMVQRNTLPRGQNIKVPGLGVGLVRDERKLSNGTYLLTTEFTTEQVELACLKARKARKIRE